MDKPGVMRKLLAAVVAILSLGVFSSAQAVDVSLRLGQGGLRHDSVKAIDFSDVGGMVGISLNLRW